MLVEDLLEKTDYLSLEERNILKLNCSQFIEDTAGTPLFKSLPATYQNFQRVKARLQKGTTELSEIYNKAFDNSYANIRQRAVLAYATPTYTTEYTDLFYVFPVNGYKFLYCKEISDSSDDCQCVIDTLFEQFDNKTTAIEIISDLLKYTYLSENLYDGIISKAEIILYNIPQYYVVRVNEKHSYEKLIHQILK